MQAMRVGMHVSMYADTCVRIYVQAFSMDGVFDSSQERVVDLGGRSRRAREGVGPALTPGACWAARGLRLPRLPLTRRPGSRRPGTPPPRRESSAQT